MCNEKKMAILLLFHGSFPTVMQLFRTFNAGNRKEEKSKFRRRTSFSN